VELKILRSEKTLQEGIEQTLMYMDKCGNNNGWLCIFDRSTDKTWDEKIYTKKEIINSKKITVVGL
jgi:hypothetical protein